jgi:hypothetical protein
VENFFVFLAEIKFAFGRGAEALQAANHVLAFAVHIHLLLGAINRHELQIHLSQLFLHPGNFELLITFKIQAVRQDPSDFPFGGSPSPSMRSERHVEFRRKTIF